MVDGLIAWDHALFQVINGLNHPFWDEFMYWISEKWPWIPAYLVCLFFVYKKEGLKGTGIFLIGIVVLIFLSDRITSGFMKPYFERLRPCRLENDWNYVVHIVKEHCGGKYGFASSHAANFFALAAFISRFFAHRPVSIFLFFLASLVAYSRVYLGVHYPGDVIMGACIGVLCAFFAWKVYSFLKNKASNQKIEGSHQHGKSH